MNKQIVRSVTNDHLGDKNGLISVAQIEMYKELADNNIGKIITAHMSIDKHYKADAYQNIVCSENINKLNIISDYLHAHDTEFIVQISHAGKKGYQNKLLINEATSEQIETVITQFIESAKVLSQSSIDGVEIHLAHGYFLSDVLDYTVNNREDTYGQESMTIITRIIEGIHESCPQLKIYVKINVNNKANSSDYSIEVDEYIKILDALSIDGIELSGSDFARKEKSEVSYYLEEALRIKQYCHTPLIVTGGFSNKEDISKALESVEYVGISRAFINNPHFVLDDYTCKCIHCNQCFALFKIKYKRCVFGKEINQLKINFSKGE